MRKQQHSKVSYTRKGGYGSTSSSNVVRNWENTHLNLTQQGFQHDQTALSPPEHTQNDTRLSPIHHLHQSVDSSQLHTESPREQAPKVVHVVKHSSERKEGGGEDVGSLIEERMGK